MEQQPSRKRLQEDDNYLVFHYSFSAFWGVHLGGFFPFISKHPSQSPHLRIRRCFPKGFHFMTTECPKKRQLGVDSAQAELSTASGYRVGPIPQWQAEEGRREILWTAGMAPQPAEHKVLCLL